MENGVVGYYRCMRTCGRLEGDRKPFLRMPEGFTSANERLEGFRTVSCGAEGRNEMHW